MANPSKTRGRILVVDDSRLVRVMLAQKPHTPRGFHVDQAENGVAALELLTGGSYDVVVTDLHMPGLDGFEVPRRREGARPGGRGHRPHRRPQPAT
jgi:CheY-like chemotaxis protein